jgi:hypothetical protein
VLACRIDAYLGTNPEPDQSRHVFCVLANAFTQLSGSGPMPLEAEFYDPCTALPSGMREAATLFEWELTRRNCRSMAPNLSGFVGMMEQVPESVYDLLPSTPGETDFKSDSEGSCNMLHLSNNGAPAAGVERMMPIQFHAPPRSRRSMSKSVWSEPELAKVSRTTNAMTLDALAHRVSTLEVRGHGHAACTIKSSKARGRRPSSPRPAKTPLRPS